jgi:hypothetical protein
LAEERDGERRFNSPHASQPKRQENVLKVDENEDGAGGDDCADALRYLVATKARTIMQRKLRGL